MRLFVAANLGSELQERVYDSAQVLREAAPGVSWTRRELLHMTLKFLGEQDASLVASLSPSLRAVGAASQAVDVQLQGYGAFPNFREPRLVWMGGDLPNSLKALAAAVDDACAAQGLEREKRSFRAHITLGRVNRRLGRDERRRLEQAVQTAGAGAGAGARHEGFTWHVETVDLMRSQLGRSGPTYTLVESFALGQRATR